MLRGTFPTYVERRWNLNVDAENVLSVAEAHFTGLGWKLDSIKLNRIKFARGSWFLEKHWFGHKSHPATLLVQADGREGGSDVRALLVYEMSDLLARLVVGKATRLAYEAELDDFEARLSKQGS